MAGPNNFDQRQPVVEYTHPTLKEAVRIEQYGSGNKRFAGDTSSVVWPIALQFGNHICDTYGDSTTDKTVVEIGAGSGLVGIISAHLPCFNNVILTDANTEFCTENIKFQPKHIQSRLASHKLLWGNTEDLPYKDGSLDGIADLVIVSDCIYHQCTDTMKELVWTIKTCLKKDREDENTDQLFHSARALLAYEFRDDWFSMTEFHTHAENMGFDVQSTEFGDDDDHLLYTMRLKKE